MTLAGTFLLAAAPAQAGTAVPGTARTHRPRPPAPARLQHRQGREHRQDGHTGKTGSTGKTGNTGKAAAQADKSAAQHYTDAGCNTTNLKPNYARCFAMVYTAVKNQIAATPDQPPPTALGPADIQTAYKLPAKPARARRSPSWTPSATPPPSPTWPRSAPSTACRRAPPPTAASPRWTRPAGPTTRRQRLPTAGGTWRPSLDLDAVSSACPNCHILLVEGNDNSIDDLGAAEDTPWRWARSSSPTPTASPARTRPRPARPLLRPPRRGGRRVHRRHRQRDQLAGHQPGRGRRRRHHADPRHRPAWLGRDRLGQRRLGLLAVRAAARTTRPASPPTARTTRRSPTSRPTPTRTPASPSSTPTARAAGCRSAAPACPRRWSPPCTRWPGTPVPGTYPVSYPYDDPNRSNDLNDVTPGSNGGCGNVLCNAGPGWDGPTGLGTPNGVSALTTGPHGDIAGKVTDAADRQPGRRGHRHRDRTATPPRPNSRATTT